MSGCGKGHKGRDRYQGKSIFTNQLQKKIKKKKKKPVSEWLYYMGFAKQASDNKALTEHLMNLIKQNFDHGINIASAIIKQEPIDKSIWIPTLRISTETDPVLRKYQLEQYKIMFNSDYN